MRFSMAWAVALALVLVPAAPTVPASGDATGGVLLVGSITSTMSSTCPQAPYPVEVRGAGVAGATWAFVLEAHAVGACILPGIAVPVFEFPFSGAWNPHAGGCVDSLAGDTFVPLRVRVCLTNPRAADGATAFDLAIGEVRPGGVSWHSWGHVAGLVVTA